MTATFNVRIATPEDAPAIARIHVASWQHAYRGHMPDALLDGLSVEQRSSYWQGLLGDPPDAVSVWVAEHAGHIVGFCSVGRARDADASAVTGELSTIYVDPSHERQGIGRSLLARGEHAMRDAGFDEAILWVLKANSNARAFYEHAGWQYDGSEKTEDVSGWLGQTASPGAASIITEVRYCKRLE